MHGTRNARSAKWTEREMHGSRNAWSTKCTEHEMQRARNSLRVNVRSAKCSFPLPLCSSAGALSVYWKKNDGYTKFGHPPNDKIDKYTKCTVILILAC